MVDVDATPRSGRQTKNPPEEPEGFSFGEATDTGCELQNPLQLTVRQQVAYLRGVDGRFSLDVDRAPDPQFVSSFLSLDTEVMARWLGVSARNARRYRSGRGDLLRLHRAVRQWLANADRG